MKKNYLLRIILFCSTIVSKGQTTTSYGKDTNIKMSRIFSYVAIPCDSFERAFKFYSDITDGLIKKYDKVPFPMAYFINKDNEYVGHLFQLPNFKPAADGPIVYLELTKDLNNIITKIEKAGGKIIMPKTLIAPGKGYWALFLDTEGNRLALHSSE